MCIKSDCTFKIDPIPLTTVRPFVLDTLRLKDTGIHFSDEKAVFSYLTDKVKSLVERINSENGSTDKKPLVRLKVSSFDVFKREKKSVCGCILCSERCLSA